MNNDCHFYDKPIQNIYSELIKCLDIVNNEDEITIWRNILDSCPDDLKQVILKLYKEDIIDSNVNDRPRNLGARLWLKIRDNDDLKKIFFSQLRDMRDTNGYCPQGRTNRFIQVLFAYMSSFLNYF